jgi:hypothetical protein
MFRISNACELKNYANGCLTWAEFLDLLFTYKRHAKNAIRKVTECEDAELKFVEYRKLQYDKQEQIMDQREIEEKKYEFIARPVPESSKELRYERMNQQRQKRREESRKRAIDKAKLEANPFTFYKKDKCTKCVKVQKEVKDYKANPIPWEVVIPLYKEMKEREEISRQERIHKRSKELASKAKLPPRMEMHERMKKEGFQFYPKPKLEEYPFKPKIKKSIPDFEVQHKVFEESLERHKQCKRPTVITPFKLSKTKKKHVEYYEPQVPVKKKNEEITSLRKPKINPPTTIKMTALANKRREQLELQKELEYQKIKEEQARRDKLKEVILLMTIRWNQ